MFAVLRAAVLRVMEVAKEMAEEMEEMWASYCGDVHVSEEVWELEALTDSIRVRQEIERCWNCLLYPDCPVSSGFDDGCVLFIEKEE